MRLSDFTTVELQRVAQALLRRYVDVRVGAASAAALEPFLHPFAATALQRLSAGGPPVREVGYGDVGPVNVVRLGPDRAYAVAPLAPPGGAAPVVLAVELEVQGPRLAAIRVGEVGSRDLDRRVDEVPLVGPGQPVPVAPAHLAGLLGDVPQEPQALERWVHGAAVIDTYRERYGIDDATSAFGPAPEDPDQRQERDRALAYVRELAREVEATEPQHGRSLDPDGSAGRELGR